MCFLLKCGLNRGVVKKVATTLTATGLNFTQVILTMCISVCKSTAEIPVLSLNITSRNVDSGLNFNPTEVRSKPPANFTYMHKTQTYG